MECSSSERSENTDTLKKPQWLDNARSKYAVGAKPCDTSNLGFRLRTVQENAGYTLNMTVTVSLELHQAVLHHGTVNEVVVVGALNSEMCDENVLL